MLKIYGADICPDCVSIKACLEKYGIPFEYVGITENTTNLKEFLRIRDTDPLYQKTREKNGIGIPLLIYEDGRMSLDSVEVLFSIWQMRRAVEDDIPRIMEIVRDAQNYLEEMGTSQWNNGYPSPEFFEADIKSGSAYVSLDQDNRVRGILCISCDGDEEYDSCVESWNSSDGYGVIHRMAIAWEARGKGLSKQMMAFAEDVCRLSRKNYIRVDTHENNQVVQSLLEKSGYVKCGRSQFQYRGEGNVWLMYDKILKEF